MTNRTDDSSRLDGTLELNRLVDMPRLGCEVVRPALHALYMFAARIPGGLEILMGEGFQLTFFKD